MVVLGEGETIHLHVRVHYMTGTHRADWPYSSRGKPSAAVKVSYSAPSSQPACAASSLGGTTWGPAGWEVLAALLAALST